MIDTSLTYIFEMGRKDQEEWPELEDAIECKIELFGKYKELCRAVPFDSRYRTKSFPMEFVEWMLYRGQARIKDSICNRYNFWLDCNEKASRAVQYTDVQTEEHFLHIINELETAPQVYKENTSLNFDVMITRFDDFIQFMHNHLTDWKNILIFNHNPVGCGIDGISGWKKSCGTVTNYRNICTGDYYYK